MLHHNLDSLFAEQCCLINRYLPKSRNGLSSIWTNSEAFAKRHASVLKSAGLLVAAVHIHSIGRWKHEEVKQKWVVEISTKLGTNEVLGTSLLRYIESFRPGVSNCNYFPSNVGTRT